MMFYLKTRRPDLIVVRNRDRELRSNKRIHFYEGRINVDIYGENPFVTGNVLSYDIQYAKDKLELNRLLTDDIIRHLKR